MRDRGRRRKRDFWREWQAEYSESEAEQPTPRRSGRGGRGRPHGGRRARARRRANHWRTFFHEYMGAWPEEHWALSGRRFNPWRQGDAAFNPLVANLLSKGGGLLALYVLHLLAERPHYGNELMEAISQRTGGGWAANPGAIYPLINVLEEQGLVKGAWEDDRKRTVRHYELTETGRIELDRLRAIFKPKLHEAIEVLQALAGDLEQEFI